VSSEQSVSKYVKNDKYSFVMLLVRAVALFSLLF